MAARLVGILYLGFAMAPASVAAVLWPYRDRPGVVPLIVAGVGAVVAAVAHGVLLLVPLLSVPESGTVVGRVVFEVGVKIAVLGAFYVAVEYTGRTRLKERWVVVTLTAAGVGVAVARELLVDGVGVLAVVLVTGNSGYNVALSFVILALFGGQFLNSRGIYRKQSATLLLGFGISGLLGTLEVTLRPAVFNLVPIGLTLGSVVIAWGLFRYELFDRVPVARTTLFEHLTDPVIAIDGDGTVVDHNEALCDLFGLTEDATGDDVETVCTTDTTLAAHHSEVLDRPEVGAVVENGRRHVDRHHPALTALRTGTALDAESPTVGIYTGETVRYFHLTTSHFDSPPTGDGRLVVFREITSEKRREEELTLLKQVLTRVLRHNLRNEITAIKGYAERIAADGADPDALAEEILATSDDLMETSRKARRIGDAIESDERVTLALSGVVEDAVDTVRSQYPDAEYETVIPDGIRVRASPFLDVALTDVIENGVVHSDADRPRVDIVACRDGAWAEITVRDNGPGVPTQELRTLRRGGETDLVHGSGAGLWLVHTIVRKSDGRITYETADGTTVRIRLPLAEES